MKSQFDKPEPYFLNFWWDFLLIGGGSFLVYALLLIWPGQSKTHHVAALAGYLSWIVNWPHFSATIQRLASSPLSQKEFPVTVFLVPWIVGAGVLCSLLAPDAVAPYFIKLYLIWSPYHFSGQTVGVTLIYARRHGFHFTKTGRWLLSAFVFSTFISATLQNEVSVKGATFYDIPYPGLGVPFWFADAAYYFMWAAGAGFITFYIYQSIRARRFPIVVLIPVAAQTLWFAWARGNTAFTALVPFFHSLQYLLIVWAMNVVEKHAEAESPSEVVRESVYWYVGNIVGGAALFHILPIVISLSGVSLGVSTAVILAGIQIHHFFVDGVVWKLNRTRVNRALTQNIRLFLRAA